MVSSSSTSSTLAETTPTSPLSSSNTSETVVQPTTTTKVEATQTRSRNVKRLKTDKKCLVFRPKDLINYESLKKRIRKFQANYATKIKTNQVTEADLSYLNSDAVDQVSFESGEHQVQQQQLLEEQKRRKEAEKATSDTLIQIPSFKIVHDESNYKKNDDFVPFKRPRQYIKFTDLPYDLALEYNITDADVAFMQEQLPHMDKSTFERVMSIISRLSIAHTCTVSTASIMDMCTLCSIPVLESDCYALAQYFKSKISRVQNSSTSAATERDMSDDKAEDVPEPGIFVQNKKSEKIINLENDYQRMFKMRQDFERLRILMEVVRKRETMKARKVRIEREILRRRHKL